MENTLTRTSRGAVTRTWGQRNDAGGPWRNRPSWAGGGPVTSAQHPRPLQSPKEQAGFMTWFTIAELKSDARFRTCIKLKFKSKSSNPIKVIVTLILTTWY